MLFKKKKERKVKDLIEISLMDLGTGDICRYLAYLYSRYDFRHLGFRTDNKQGVIRCTIYALVDNPRINMYFADRCPAMIEDFILENIVNSNEKFLFETIVIDDILEVVPLIH